MQLLFLTNWMNEGLARSIGWTLVHSLWQGLIAAALAGVIILSTRHAAARLRYNLIGVVMILFVASSMITLVIQVNQGKTLSLPGLILNYSATELDLKDSQVSNEVSQTGMLDSAIAFFNANANLFVTCWALFFILHCIRLMTGLAGVNRLRYTTSSSIDAEWKKRLESLSEEMGISRTVKMIQSATVKVPVAIGFLRPLILVPAGLFIQLPPEQVETILIHELAHIRRNDYLVNIAQRIIEAIFFFNPAVSWISSLLRQEREACCDDIVVANTSRKGIYLEALVSFQESTLTSKGYAMAIGTNKQYLLNRVKRMLTRENKKLNRMEKSILICCLLGVTAFSFINKKDVPVVQASVINEPFKPVPVNPRSEIPAVNKATPKKAKSAARRIAKPTNITAQVISDTIPEEKPKQPTKKFEGISRQINDDGKTRTESVIATDRDGKKYSFTRNNGKVTDLKVDGKTIPENEIKNYSEVLEHLDAEMKEGNKFREKMAEQRQANLRRQQESRERKRQELTERLQEEKSRIQEESRIRQREKISRVADEERNERLMEAEKRVKVDRKVEKSRIENLKRKQLQIERRLEVEKKNLLETQRKIEIERKIEAERNKTNKTSLNETDFKMNLVKNFDVQSKFELKNEVKVEPTKFDVRTKVPMTNDMKPAPAVPKTPKPPIPPATPTDESKTLDKKQKS